MGLAVWVWLAVALIIAYAVGIALYALRVPFGDDHAMISAAAFGAAQTPADAWAALSAQHNEHRPVVVRLVFWLADLLPGPLDVALIAWAGNLFLVLMFALLLREGHRVSAPGPFIVVAAALMFNFGLSESSIWPMAAVSNFGVLAMMLAMLALLSMRGITAWLALSPALLAVGLQGNGLFVPFLGAAYLLTNKRPPLRRRSGSRWALRLPCGSSPTTFRRQKTQRP